MNTDEKFVLELKNQVIGKTLSDYLEMLKSIELDSVSDEGWKAFIAFIRTHPKGNELAEQVLRQIMTDTLSATLGAIDGSYLLSGFRGELTLSYDGEIINGELLPLLREHEEQ